MKKVLLIIIVLCSLVAKGQTPIIEFTPTQEIISRYDTTVLFEGIKLADKYHIHRYIQKDMRKPFDGVPGATCAVYHGPTGCPNEWKNFNLICSQCYRHINVQETRYLKRNPDIYEEILKKLNNYLNG